jgi:hypothetical protein
MADPRQEGGEAFLAALLAPVRSGLILVRRDLERTARELGLGCRAGERHFALRALLNQEAGGVLGWLAAFAAEAAVGYRELEPGARCAAYWAERATVTAELLDELARASSSSSRQRT